MPAWAQQVFRAFVLMLLVYTAVAWAVATQASAPVWGAILLALAGWLALRFRAYLTARARAKESRWDLAVDDPAERPTAIEQARRSLSSITPPAPKNRGDFVRISLTLAELLDADERYTEAVTVADGIALGGLSAIDEGLVRHTQAVTHLRASDTQGAVRALRGRAVSGDRELDERLSLLDAYTDAELGNTDAAMAKLEVIETDETLDPSVAAETRVVRAAVLDACGEHEEALVVLAAVGRANLQPIAQLGLPRVRAMAHQILRGASSRPPGIR